MAFKDLFIKSDETDKPKETKKEVSQTKFPKVETQETNQSTGFGFGFGKSDTPTFTPVGKGEYSQEHLDKALEVYRNGFDSLNQAGYDFYEFYQAITEAGADNAMAYTMAFKMAKTMDKSISKETLLQQSEFYTSEIVKSYNSFISGGNAKKEELLNQKNHENESLANELDLMKQQMEQLKVQIQDRETKLKAIDGKFAPKLSEIDSKLAANDVAKNTVISSIEQVKQGIINNLK